MRLSFLHLSNEFSFLAAASEEIFAFNSRAELDVKVARLPNLQPDRETSPLVEAG